MQRKISNWSYRHLRRRGTAEHFDYADSQQFRGLILGTEDWLGVGRPGNRSVLIKENQANQKSFKTKSGCHNSDCKD